MCYPLERQIFWLLRYDLLVQRGLPLPVEDEVEA